MPIFQTMGLPCSIGMLISVVIALTLVPAVLTIGSGVGLFDPTRTIGFGRWRRIGTAIVRWPAPILCATIAVAVVGLATLPGYKTSYNDRLLHARQRSRQRRVRGRRSSFQSIANDARNR